MIGSDVNDFIFGPNWLAFAAPATTLLFWNMGTSGLRAFSGIIRLTYLT
jgi:hypothetical protein